MTKRISKTRVRGSLLSEGVFDIVRNKGYQPASTKEKDGRTVPKSDGVRPGMAEGVTGTGKEVVTFGKYDFKRWKSHAQQEGYEIREAGTLPGSYAAYANGKQVGYFMNEFDLPNDHQGIVGKLLVSQSPEEDMTEDGGGGGYNPTPKYKVGDMVYVRNYQGIGKIAYIKHRGEVGVMFKEPSHLRVVTTIDDLRPSRRVAEGSYLTGGNWEEVDTIRSTQGRELGSVLRHHNGTYAYYDERKAHVESGFSTAQEARRAFVDMFNSRKQSMAEAPLDWQGTYSGTKQAATTDHTFDEANKYIKANYPFAKTYKVRRAEPGFRVAADPSEFRRSEAHVTDVDGAVDYLQLKPNAMMSGSQQVTLSIGYSWMTLENPSTGIAILYYQDRGMGADEITIGGKTQEKHLQAKQVFRDAGVLPAPRSVSKKGVAEGFDSAAFDRHMQRLKSQKELEKSDPLRALVNQMKHDGRAARSAKQTSQDDDRQITDPFHPSQSVNIGQQGVAEAGDPKKDVEAIRAAIARMEREIADPNPHIDREKLRQRIAWEKRRLNLYRDVEDVAEAGIKPVEKYRLGMGDNRTARELKTQMQGASDKFVNWAAKDVGPFHSRVAKMQGKLAKSELRSRAADHDRLATGTNEGVAEGIWGSAQDLSQSEHGWRATLVDEIDPSTFEVKVTNSRSKESGNFVVRPVDMLSYKNPRKLQIDSMDIRDLQTGKTSSITSDVGGLMGHIFDAVDALFWDTPELQKRLRAQIEGNNVPPMMPGLDKRRAAGGDRITGDQAVKINQATQNALTGMQNMSEGNQPGKWVVQYWDKQPGNDSAHREFATKPEADRFAQSLPRHYAVAVRPQAKSTRPDMGESLAESSASSLEKKIQTKQDALMLAREQRRAKGQRQQGQREIKLQAEIDRLNTELTQLKRQDVKEGWSDQDPEQRAMDATRWARQRRGRQPRGSEAIDDRLRAENEYRLIQQPHWVQIKSTGEYVAGPFPGKTAANREGWAYVNANPGTDAADLQLTPVAPPEKTVTSESVTRTLSGLVRGLQQQLRQERAR